jgi:hypothetical protein
VKVHLPNGVNIEATAAEFVEITPSVYLLVTGFSARSDTSGIREALNDLYKPLISPLAFPCDQCSRSFASKRGRARHRTWAHPKARRKP